MCGLVLVQASSEELLRTPNVNNTLHSLYFQHGCVATLYESNSPKPWGAYKIFASLVPQFERGCWEIAKISHTGLYRAGIIWLMDSSDGRILNPLRINGLPATVASVSQSPESFIKALKLLEVL